MPRKPRRKGFYLVRQPGFEICVLVDGRLHWKTYTYDLHAHGFHTISDAITAVQRLKGDTSRVAIIAFNA